jgi:hypothetical protein
MYMICTLLKATTETNMKKKEEKKEEKEKKEWCTFLLRAG